MAEEKSTGNQSLIRGLRLLDMLSDFPNGCPLAKLAEISGLNKSTVHRLLQGLQREGYVKPASTAGSYRLSIKCLSIGQKILTSMNIINVVSPYLEQLNLTLGETINFSQREDDKAIMIYKLEPTHGMFKTRAYIGQHISLYCSAMGKLYLAYPKKEGYLSYYWQTHQNVIQQLTKNTITQLDEMEVELENIRQNKFAMDKEENEMGVVCIACPIFDSFHQVEYAVSVSMSIYKLKKIGIDFFLNEIKKTALEIPKELGYTGEI
ncbi:IclR family transcriptional regulator [Rodentibacter haemolyticus]|uniref:IclR family transcriptional regulator n=1 Tax=Rodentibacter haemolyticus TaxID=2778911 RepID=A0ABX6UYB9_9PAST|nr:IclR family transcriptional regulator [Rodentibacter haemolyticus]QPB42285.1 IclR family transcriptional regulator [Rodentibacter haemolyticus]